MPSFYLTFTAIFAGIVAISYPLFFRDLIYTTAGIGRVVEDISAFPYSCRRIRHPRLEGCEDMWFDADKRVLYAACAPSYGRMWWTPSMTYLNVSGRSLEDHVVMLDVDNPGADGLFGLRELELKGYTGVGGFKNMDVHGFDVDIVDDKTLRFYMVNHRPATDSSGQFFLDPLKSGANSTVEMFDVPRGFQNTHMKWVKTVADEAIYTPNRVAATQDGGFLVTNDKPYKGT
jgi:hypothetical protein